MNDAVEMIGKSVPNQEAANALMERLFDVASPEAVFSEPVTQGEYAVITASEVSVGLGFGYGGGGELTSGEDNEGGQSPVEETKRSSGGFGGGGGGGGGATARPVAAIEVGPNGVRVEPIVDPTKIALAFFTALGSMFLMFARMAQAAKENG